VSLDGGWMAVSLARWRLWPFPLRELPWLSGAWSMVPVGTWVFTRDGLPGELGLSAVFGACVCSSLVSKGAWVAASLCFVIGGIIIGTGMSLRKRRAGPGGTTLRDREYVGDLDRLVRVVAGRAVARVTITLVTSLAVALSAKALGISAVG
jgi:hypothetical protein